MANLQDLINSLAADGFTAEEGQQILNQAGGDFQSIADASGFSLDEVDAFVRDNNLQVPTSSNAPEPLDLSNLTGLLNYDPYDVPQQSSSAKKKKKDKKNTNLAGTALDTYNMFNAVSGAQGAQTAYNAAKAAVAANTQAATAGNALAAEAAKGLANEAAAAKAALFMPGLNIFAGLVKMMGLFEGGGLQETPYTTEDAIELLKGEQERLSSQTESSTEDSEGSFANSEFMQAEIDKGIKALYGDLAEEKGVLDDGGFVRDEQGFLRDTDTGQYWILNDKGSLMRTTPPLVPVPMPEITPTAGGGGGSTSGTSGGGASPTGGGSDAPGDWVYDADAGVFRQTGGVETIVPQDGSYNDGDVVSWEDMVNVFERWGDNSTDNTPETPSEDDVDVVDIIDIITNNDGSGGGTDVPSSVGGLTASPSTGGSTDVPGDDGLSDGDSDLINGDGDLTGDGGIATVVNDTVVDDPIVDDPIVDDPVVDDTVVDDPDPGTGTGGGTGSGNGTGDGTGNGTGLIGLRGMPAAPVTQALFKNDIDLDVRRSSLLNLAKYLV